MSQHIKCAICDLDVHAVKIHLRDNHGPESESPMTLEEYETKYPEAPLLSEFAKNKIAEHKAQKAANAEIKERAKEAKQSLATLFQLGKSKAARTASGNDIMIEVSQQTGFEEMIPKVDPNYVFDIDNLKTVLMGLQVNIPTYVFGHAGTGKSTLFEQVCARTNRRMLRVQHTINTEESHIVGQWGVVHHKDPETGQMVSVTEWMPGPLQLAMIHGWTYVADEYDRAYPSVLSCYQAVLEGKPLFTKEASTKHRMITPVDGFRFVATGNTNGAGDDTGLYQATVMQDAATFERFGIVIEQKYLPKSQEVSIVRGQAGVDQEDAKNIVEYARAVRDMHPQEISLTLGPRVLINIAKIGLMKGSFLSGVTIAFANRLPAVEREAALKTAQRYFGDA